MSSGDGAPGCTFRDMQGQSLVPEDFAARVRAARAYKDDMTQAALAEALGMSPGYVKHVEKGKGLKPLEAVALLERLPKITGLSRAFFLGESKDDAATKLDDILTVVKNIQASTKERYDSLERRLGGLDPEAADAAIRLLAEAQTRAGQDTERPPQPGGPATDRRTGS